MKIEKTVIPDLVVIKPQVHGDERGYFFESYKETEFSALGLPTRFVQDNQSKSKRGVLRGLHYQLNHPQGKLVWVTHGKVLDVAVDIRKGSPTFGQSVSTLLDDENHHRFYVPPGFAHGYYVLSETALFQYKCTDIYHPEDEYGIKWDDPDIGISWGDGDKFVSSKDARLSTLKDMDEALLPQYEMID